MNHGWHQTVNDVVYFHQTLFNITLILEQLSKNNNILREQVKMKKSEHRIKNNMISEEKMLDQE